MTIKKKTFEEGGQHAANPLRRSLPRACKRQRISVDKTIPSALEADSQEIVVPAGNELPSRERLPRACKRRRNSVDKTIPSALEAGSQEIVLAEATELPSRQRLPRACKRPPISVDDNIQSALEAGSQAEATAVPLRHRVPRRSKRTRISQEERAVSISRPAGSSEVDVIRTNRTGSKMAIMSNEDLARTLATPKGDLINKRKRINLEQLIFKSSSQLSFRRNLEFGTAAYNEKLMRSYNKEMEALPKFPCINCGCLVRNCRMRLLKNTESSIQEIPSTMWQLDAYYRWMRKEQPTLEDPTLESLKDHLRICLTCVQQLKSSNDKLR